jgi:hypothetical protein
MIFPTTLVVMFGIVSVFLSGCNDLPTDIGTELVPGTDTLYATSLLNDTLLTGITPVTERLPNYNGTYSLFGKTNDSEARMFFELTTYPTLGNSTDWEVTSSEMVFLPQAYIFGDTTSTTLAVTAYELKQVWSANATWDSIWASDGSTSYYNTADQPVCTFTKDLTSTDTIVYVPFSTSATKRWIELGSDSSTKDQVFGLVLLPTGGASIRQYRNLNGNTQVMQLRVGIKHKDSTEIDTLMLTAVTSTFVNSPEAAETDVIIQGARIHNTSFDVDITMFEEFAIMLGASFTITVDRSNSTVGTLGLDELLDLVYTSTSGGLTRMSARVDADGNYNWISIVPILQQIRMDGGKGTMRLQPSDANRLWRMNRLRFYDASAEETKRPRMKIVYSIPTVFQ